MGTSIENGGGEEGEEEEIIPWSCVDEVIRNELIQRLNPDQIMSGNNWRGLAGRLGYTTTEIMNIESDKEMNTRVVFNKYNFKEGSSFNEVYHCLQEMERKDCLTILENFLPRIKLNFEREKEKAAQLLQQCNSTSGMSHSHHPSIGASCGGCSCSHHPLNSMPHSAGPQQHMCFPACNHGGYPTSTCYHGPPGHPVPMPGSCMAAVCGSHGNHSPTKNCQHMCSQQQTPCIHPHLQMDISQHTSPKCSPYYHPATPTPPTNHSNISNMAFSDRAQLGAASPSPYQFYNVRTPSYSPGISPESNNKPFNFSGHGNFSNGGMMVDGNGPMGRGVARGNGNAMNMNQSGPHSQVVHNMEQQPNLLVNKGNTDHPLPDNISPHFNSMSSSENNMSYPGTSLNQHYGMGNGLPHQAQYHHATGSQGNAATGINPAVMDSKKSLQKLTEISKMPNQYQPTNEYKTVVAEQKIENKKQRGRTTRGNGTGSIISSSSGSSTSSSSSSSSSGPPVPKNVSGASNQREDLPPMAGLSIGKPQAVPNNIQPEPDKRDVRSKVFITYSRDSEDQKLEVLRLSMFLNDNDIMVYADVATDPSAMSASEMQGNMESYQEYFALADFILVCISPKYLEDISRTSPPSAPSTPTNGSSRPIHTHEIFQMMKAEHGHRISSRAGGNQRNKSRFVSLLFGDMTPDQVPDWLKKHYPIYRWTSDYENIGWYLKKPRERICGQPHGK